MQLHEGDNLEHAPGSWWDVPILAVEAQDVFPQSKVFDLIWTLREAPAGLRSRF